MGSVSVVRLPSARYNSLFSAGRDIGGLIESVLTGASDIKDLKNALKNKEARKIASGILTIKDITDGVKDVIRTATEGDESE